MLLSPSVSLAVVFSVHLVLHQHFLCSVLLRHTPVQRGTHIGWTLLFLLQQQSSENAWRLLQHDLVTGAFLFACATMQMNNTSRCRHSCQDLL